MQSLKEKELLEALMEIDFILQHTDEDLKNKVPQSFWDFLEKNENKEYQVMIDLNKPLEEQNIKESTKDLMALVYRNFFCNQEEKQEYDEILKNNLEKEEQKKREKYDPDNIFKKNLVDKELSQQEIINNNENTQIVQYKEENIFINIINNVKNFFLRFINKS